MTKVLMGLILLSLCLFAEPDWTHSYTDAKKQAMKEHKLIMLMLSKEHCQACWYMEKIVFKEDKVNTLVRNNFIPVYVDIHKDVVPSEFDYIGTPTFYFLNAQGELIAPRMDGANNVKDFTKKINKILQK